MDKSLVVSEVGGLQFGLVGDAVRIISQVLRPSFLLVFNSF